MDNLNELFQGKEIATKAIEFKQELQAIEEKNKDYPKNEMKRTR